MMEGALEAVYRDTGSPGSHLLPQMDGELRWFLIFLQGRGCSPSCRTGFTWIYVICFNDIFVK